MNNLLKTVGGVVVLAFFAGGSAFAAAGDAQKWNIGISAGYAMTNKPSVALNRQEIIDKQIKNYPVTNSKFSKSLNGVAANINIGYSMNDNVRFGLGVGYRQLKFNKAKGFEQMKYDKDIGMSTKVLTGGATVYYDFINNSLLTPFVSLGFGMQHVTGKFDLPLYGDEDKYEGEIGTPGKTGQAKITSHDGKLKRKND